MIRFFFLARIFYGNLSRGGAQPDVDKEGGGLRRQLYVSYSPRSNPRLTQYTTDSRKLQQKCHEIFRLGSLFLLVFFLNSCAHDTRHRIIISVADQKMILLEDGKRVAMYGISTSKYGLGDAFGSYATPVGHLIISQKIGEGVPSGMVFKDRKPTGEILSPNTPSRDPIVTRILWLQGTEPQNRNAHARYIYIHGTPEEKNLGQPKSYGCIRMSSADVIQLYERIGKGTKVEIVEGRLEEGCKEKSNANGISNVIFKN